MLTRHILIYFLARGLPALFSFLGIFLYSHLLLPEEYGRYGIVIVAVGLVNAFLFQWLRLGLLRFLPGFTDKRRQVLLSTIFIGFLVLAGFSGLLGGAALWFWPNQEDFRNLWLLGLAMLWIRGLFELNQQLHRSQLSPIQYGLQSLSKAVFGFGFSLLLITIGWGAEGLLLGTIIGTAISFIFVIGRDWKGIHPRFVDCTLMSKLMVYGLPLTVTGSLEMVINSSDRLFLGWLSGVNETGLYGLAYDFTHHILILLMMVVNLAAYPLVVHKLENEGLQAARDQLEKNLIVLLFISVPATVGLILLTPNISQVLFGDDFSAAAFRILPLIALAMFFQGLKEYYLDLAFHLGKRTILQIWPVLLAAGMNVGLNLLWIPKLGIIGAAYATLAAFAAAFVMSWFVGRKVFFLPLPVMQICKIFLAALLMTITLLPFLSYRGTVPLIGQTVLGGLSYIAAIIFLNVGGIQRKIKPLLERAFRGEP